MLLSCDLQSFFAPIYLKIRGLHPHASWRHTFLRWLALPPLSLSSGTPRDFKNYSNSLFGSSPYLALNLAGVPPSDAAALAARLLISGAGRQAGGASLPVGLVLGAANDARAAFGRRDLRTLAVDHLRRVRQGSAARADRYRLRLLPKSLFRFGFRCLVRHGCAQLTPNLFIWETVQP